ncbi:MAG TPA: hypothetical protein VG890_04830 [Puia sp.]|nr:hypothetical protein [Puia sp.]
MKKYFTLKISFFAIFSILLYLFSGCKKDVKSSSYDKSTLEKDRQSLEQTIALKGTPIQVPNPGTNCCAGDWSAIQTYSVTF